MIGKVQLGRLRRKRRKRTTRMKNGGPGVKKRSNQTRRKITLGTKVAKIGRRPLRRTRIDLGERTTLQIGRNKTNLGKKRTTRAAGREGTIEVGIIKTKTLGRKIIGIEKMTALTVGRTVEIATTKRGGTTRSIGRIEEEKKRMSGRMIGARTSGTRRKKSGETKRRRKRKKKSNHPFGLTTMLTMKVRREAPFGIMTGVRRDLGATQHLLQQLQQ
mmetsp:Transcript_84682/g.133751  ORF Transcript_84682/g.133751 Transcript_84682/m.133751 type:complete len:216 (+) Transcript_84682:210-857(+)